ncbi:MAG: PAS domain S-box protein [Bacteroidota bacterium]
MNDDQNMPEPAAELQSATSGNYRLFENDLKDKHLLLSLPVAIYTCNNEGLIESYNDAAVTLWGRTPEIGKDHWCGSCSLFRPDGSVLPIDEYPVAIALTEREKITGTEIILERPDGEQRNVLSHPEPIFDDAGNISGVVTTLIDITVQKRMDSVLSATIEMKVRERIETLNRKTTDLLAREERYLKMIDEVQDYAILMLDKNGIIVNWNKGVQKIKGYSAHEIVGKKFSMFYREEDKLDGLPERLLNEAKEQGHALHEGWRVRKDGTHFWGSIAITALHDSENEVIGYTKVTRDLTDRKQYEEDLSLQAAELAKKNKKLEHSNSSLEQFAYVSSHDLQEPLRKIQTFSNIVLTRMHEPGFDAHEYLTKINASANRMSLLINELLNFSRFSNTDILREKTDLNWILDLVLNDFELLIKQKNAVIRRSPLPIIEAIPIQMNQLFYNMISNSLKFCSDTPLIDITARELPAEAVPALPILKPEKPYLHLNFTDNGIGFDQTNASRIFTIFQRLHDTQKYSGTGLGLAICKKITENHGGHISASSEAGKGASFDIYLPITEH